MNINYETFKQLDKEDDHQIWYTQPSNWIRGLVAIGILCILGWLYYSVVGIQTYFATDIRKAIVLQSNWKQESKVYHWEAVNYKNKSHLPNNAYNNTSHEDCELVSTCMSTNDDGSCSFETYTLECETLYNYTIDEWVYQFTFVNNGKGNYKRVANEYDSKDQFMVQDKVFFTTTFNNNSIQYQLTQNKEYKVGDRINVKFWTYNNQPKEIQ